MGSLTVPLPPILPSCPPLLCPPRSPADPEKLLMIEEAGEDLSSHPWFQNVRHTTMQQFESLQPPEPEPGTAAAGAGGTGDAAAAAPELPADIRRALMRAGVPVDAAGDMVAYMAGLPGVDPLRGVGGAGRAAEAAGKASVSVQAARRQLLLKAVKEWVTTYAGEALTGWQQRPKVGRQAWRGWREYVGVGGGSDFTLPHVSLV